MKISPKMSLLILLVVSTLITFTSCHNPKNVYMPKGTVHSNDVHRNGGCGWTK